MKTAIKVLKKDTPATIRQKELIQMRRHLLSAKDAIELALSNAEDYFPYVHGNIDQAKSDLTMARFYAKGYTTRRKRP